MSVGTEWIIDAGECDAEALRDVARLQSVFQRLIADLALQPVGAGLWHKFGGEGGVTGLILLTESHIACHTYPELHTATFNLYCCRTRPAWDWQAHLFELIGAKNVSVVRITRGAKRENLSQTADGGAKR